MSIYREQLEEYLSRLDIKATNLLDVGGSAYPIKGRVKTFDVANYKILDNNNELNKHDKWTAPDYIADIENWEGTRHTVPTNFFDYVVCLEVFEYIYEPLKALDNISNYAINGGTLLISFPFIYPVHQPIESDYLRYTPAGARKLLQEAGFEVIQEDFRFAGSAFLPAYYQADGLRAAKGVNHAITGSIIQARKV